eukprot:2464911-Pyramimonas_sp.AAC.1
MRKSFESTVGASFGPSSAYAVIVKHKFGDEGEDVEEWFLVSSKVGRATFWIAPLCQNFDAVNPGGLGVVSWASDPAGRVPRPRGPLELPGGAAQVGQHVPGISRGWFPAAMRQGT